MPNCTLCDGTQFYESAGFFYCRTCNTQCHDLQNTVNETDYGTQNLERGTHAQPRRTAPEPGQNEIQINEPKEPSIFTPGEPASLFVLADVILRAQVLWLSENAGVSQAFAETVKTVWFSYLAKSLPDMQHGVAAALMGPRNQWMRSLRKSDLTELSNRKPDELKAALQFWKVDYRERPTEKHDTESSDHESEAKSERRSIGTTVSSSDPRTCPERISLSKIFAILSVSLYICNESVMISDLLRWTRLLLLPCVDPSSVIPDDQLTTFYQLSSNKSVSEVSYNQVEWEMGVLMRSLDISPMHLQSIAAIVDRFIAELNLPKNFLPIAASIADSISLTNFRLDFTSTTDHACIRCPENLEAFAMSVIIFSLRIVFALDDKTESVLIAQARKIQEKITDGSVLFDLGEWMHYIDCRRLAMYKYTALMENRSANAAVGFISRNLIAEKRKLTWSKLKRNKFQDENYEDIQRALQEMDDVQFKEKIEFVQVPLTLRPFLAHGSALAKFMAWLDTSFRDDSLEHLLYKHSGVFGCETSGDCEEWLEIIKEAQTDGFGRMTLVRTCNAREQLKLVPQLNLVPSLSLQWLIRVCAEMIEQRPEALLGNFMFLESCLFSKCLHSTAFVKCSERMQRLGIKLKKR